jgi:hypothetical protein
MNLEIGSTMIRRLIKIPTIVYHGTTTKFKGALESIDLSKGRTFADFGQGFYATSNFNQAMAFARGKTRDIVESELELFSASNGKYTPKLVKPLVVTYKVNVYILNRLSGKIFSLPDDKWAEFVYNNRVGGNLIISNFHNWNKSFDFVYGHLADTEIAPLIKRIKKGEIDYKEFCKEMKPLNPNTDNQISFHTSKAVRGLKFVKEVIDDEFAYKEKTTRN